MQAAPLLGQQFGDGIHARRRMNVARACMIQITKQVHRSAVIGLAARLWRSRFQVLPGVLSLLPWRRRRPVLRQARHRARGRGNDRKYGAQSGNSSRASSRWERPEQLAEHPSCPVYVPSLSAPALDHPVNRMGYSRRHLFGKVAAIFAVKPPALPESLQPAHNAALKPFNLFAQRICATCYALTRGRDKQG